MHGTAQKGQAKKVQNKARDLLCISDAQKPYLKSLISCASKVKAQKEDAKQSTIFSVTRVTSGVTMVVLVISLHKSMDPMKCNGLKIERTWFLIIFACFDLLCTTCTSRGHKKV